MSSTGCARVQQVLDDAMRTLRTRSSPYALLVKKRTFDTYKLQSPTTSKYDACLGLCGAGRACEARSPHPVAPAAVLAPLTATS